MEFVFFDIRDTLGYVDQPGHLVPYRPTTERLLRDLKELVGLKMGVITNLPKSVSAAQCRSLLDDAGITPYLVPEGIVINHEAGHCKPSAAVYEYAAAAVGVPIDRCCFVGENFIEVLGAHAAGMLAVLKPYPPGGDFKLQIGTADPVTTPTDRRMNFEVILKDEHILAKRITLAADALAKAIRACSKDPPLRAMALLVKIVNGYVDPYHHRKEEEVLIPFALGRGMPPEECDWVVLQHDQGRAYFRAMTIALRRAQTGESVAVQEFADLCDAFVRLYRHHGPREDSELFSEIGKYLRASDDALIVEMFNQIGSRQINLWLALVGELETEIGISPPAIA